MIDFTLTCPTCGKRADMCFAHGEDWKKRPPLGEDARGHIRYLLNYIGVDPDATAAELAEQGAPQGITAARAALGDE